VGGVETVQETPDHALAHVDRYLQIAQESSASDLHLGVNAQPCWRRFGNIEPVWLRAPKLSDAETRALAEGFLTDAQKALLEERGDVDFAYATEFGRCSGPASCGIGLGIDVVFRIISTTLRTMDDLGLPESLKLLTQYHNGLVLVTGSVGSGKSTTLAALVERGEPQPARPHHHAGRSHRIRPGVEGLPHHPARSPYPHEVFRRRPARRVA